MPDSLSDALSHTTAGRHIDGTQRLPRICTMGSVMLAGMTPQWHELDEEDRGLLYDLPTLMSRRRALGLLGGAGLAGFLAACGSSTDGSGAAASSTSASTSTSSRPS